MSTFILLLTHVRKVKAISVSVPPWQGGATLRRDYVEAGLRCGGATLRRDYVEAGYAAAGLR